MGSLQALLSMKASLELSLAELEGRYGAMMMSLQASVVSLEGQLTRIHADTERTGQEYRALLDIKTRLEMEITEYRRLLEGEATGAVAVGGGRKQRPQPHKFQHHHNSDRGGDRGDRGHRAGGGSSWRCDHHRNYHRGGGGDRGVV